MQAQAAWLLVVVVVAGAASVQALTAFGKSTNPEKDKTPTRKYPLHTAIRWLGTSKFISSTITAFPEHAGATCY